MEALKNLVANVPDWLKKLNELSGQIEQRQIELAKLTEENKTSSSDGAPSTKSVRNKGSTESLKPRDEPEAHPTDPTQPDAADNAADTEAAAAAGAAAAKASAEQTLAAPASPSHSQSPSALQRQASQMRAAGQARARATLRKRQRSDSVISADGAAPKYRTRSMIIVYYDSYVQMFFEELVKFVSASRNMMRKAKMAAKVAKIKRLAELEAPADDDEDEAAPSPRAGAGLAAGDAPIAAAPSRDGETEIEVEPPLQYVSTRRLGPSALMMSRNMYARAGGRGPNPASMMGAGANPAAPDVYDELDKGLEYVQSMCEHAAHQFLRDGECGEEVANIKRRLGETNELANKEMERVQKEDPQALLKTGGEDDGMRGRSYRPQSMRRDAMPKAELKAGPLEVDEGGEEEELPKLVYKSTRMMR